MQTDKNRRLQDFREKQLSRIVSYEVIIMGAMERRGAWRPLISGGCTGTPERAIDPFGVAYDMLHPDNCDALYE
jgi:hypothetical protein